MIRRNYHGQDEPGLRFAVIAGHVIVMLDADGSADRRVIPGYVALLRAAANFARGSRFTGAGGHPPHPRPGQPVPQPSDKSLNTSYSNMSYRRNVTWVHCLAFLNLTPPSRLTASAGQAEGIVAGRRADLPDPRQALETLLGQTPGLDRQPRNVLTAGSEGAMVRFPPCLDR